MLGRLLAALSLPAVISFYVSPPFLPPQGLQMGPRAPQGPLEHCHTLWGADINHRGSRRSKQENERVTETSCSHTMFSQTPPSLSGSDISHSLRYQHPPWSTTKVTKAQRMRRTWTLNKLIYWAKQSEWWWLSLPEGRSEGASSYFDSPYVLEKTASVMFVFQGETSEHLWCSSEQHAGLELQAASVHKNA